MSSAVVSTSAALGRPFLFDDDPEAEVRSLPAAKKPVASEEPALAKILQSTINNQQSTISLTPASKLEIRPAPEMASIGIPDLDTLTGGLPRGCLTEICGPASSGRTTVLLAALAAATRRGEYCALLDASDSLDPHSVAAAGVDLDRLLWVRCGEDSPLKENSPPRHRGTEKKNQKERIQLRGENQCRAPPRTSPALDRPAARKRRLRPHHSRPRRPAAAVRPPHPADHMVPLPPRRRTQAHHPARDRAAPNRRKLLVAAAAIGHTKIFRRTNPVCANQLQPRSGGMGKPGTACLGRPPERERVP